MGEKDQEKLYSQKCGLIWQGTTLVPHCTHTTHTHTQLRREVYLFSEHVEKPRSIFEVEGLKCIVCGPAPTERERESERGGGGGGGGGGLYRGDRVSKFS